MAVLQVMRLTAVANRIRKKTTGKKGKKSKASKKKTTKKQKKSKKSKNKEG